MYSEHRRWRNRPRFRSLHVRHPCQRNSLWLLGCAVQTADASALAATSAMQLAAHVHHWRQSTLVQLNVVQTLPCCQLLLLLLWRRCVMVWRLVAAHLADQLVGDGLQFPQVVPEERVHGSHC